MCKTVTMDKELKAEVCKIARIIYSYTNNTRAICNTINDYLKQTVKDVDYADDNETYSSAYSAIILKEANSHGFAEAFKVILDELKISSTIKHIFSNNECDLWGIYVNNSNNEVDMYSPYSEKICNRNLIPYDAWIKVHCK